MGILNAYLRNYASTVDRSRNGQYELYIREIKRGALFRKTQILVVLTLKSDLLFLEEIIDLVDDYKKDDARAARASFKILVGSPKGSIYLHESISNAEVWRKRMKGNRACVINSENGTICVTPGNGKNAILGERLKALLEERKNMNGIIFEREVFTIFNLCVDAMDSR